MRIRGEPTAIDLAAETVQLVFGQAALQERARVDSGRAVALEVDQVARMLVGRSAKEVVEAHVVERGGGRERGDVSPEIVIALVGTEHHGKRVPPNQRANPALHEQVAWHERLVGGWDRVPVRGRQQVGQTLTGLRQPRRKPLHQHVGPIDPVFPDDGLQCIEPLLRLLRIDVLNVPRVFHRNPLWSARMPVCRALYKLSPFPLRTMHKTEPLAKRLSRAAGRRRALRSRRRTARA